jgi:type IV secretory pathway ATPase VirB11/archaellum biosynthesis ATPase
MQGILDPAGIASRLRAIAGGQGTKSAPEGQEPASLCFSIVQEYPEKIAWSDNRIVVGEKGQRRVYSLLALNLDGNDVRTACKVKRELIDVLSDGQEIQYSREGISRAQQMAAKALEKHATTESKELISYVIAHDTVGFGPISVLLEDQQNIEEIVINAPTAQIGIYHATYGYCVTNMRFNSERDFRYTLNKMLASTEREINTSTPIIDAQFNDGSRIHAQLKPYSVNGTLATIRLNGGKHMDIRRILQLGTATPEELAYLWLAIESNLNIVIAGAPASGKTSFLLALNSFVPRYSRVITIEEDINELRQHSNFTNMVSLQGSSIKGRASLKEQVINALHLRPDRLIIGEIRGSETGEVLSGSNFGVPFMTTMHSSDNGNAVISRLQAKPMSVEQHLIAMLDVSIFMRQKGMQARALDSIAEFRWLCRNEIDVECEEPEECRISYIVKDGALSGEALYRSKVVNAYSKEHGLRPNAVIKEFRARAAFLEELKNKCETEPSEYIASYRG